MKIKYIILTIGLLINLLAFGQNHTDDILKCNIETIKELRINKDNISEKLIHNFLLSFDESCKNHVEYSQAANWTLFWLADIETKLFLETLKENQDDFAMNWIIFQFRQPIHDGIDLEAIYKKIQSLNYDDKFVRQILVSIKEAGKGLGIEME